jgi:hypothetical protein
MISTLGIIEIKYNKVGKPFKFSFELKYSRFNLKSNQYERNITITLEKGRRL